MAIVKPTKNDLYAIYGSTNIDQWADASNTRNPTEKEARITWAIDEAYRYVVGRLSLKYDITLFVDLPEQVFSLVARRAGIELYEGPRGIIDGDAATMVLNQMSIKVEAMIEQILSGQLPLMDVTSITGAPINVPDVVNTPCNIRNDALRGTSHNEQWDGLPSVLSDYAPFYLDN